MSSLLNENIGCKEGAELVEGRGTDLDLSHLEDCVARLPRAKLKMYEITGDDWEIFSNVLIALGLDTGEFEGDARDKSRAWAKKMHSDG